MVACLDKMVRWQEDASGSSVRLQLDVDMKRTRFDAMVSLNNRQVNLKENLSGLFEEDADLLVETKFKEITV